MESKKEAAERAKLYRVRNKEEIRTREKERWHKKKKFQRRAKALGRRRCAFCEILLSAKSVGMKSMRYCDDCRERLAYKRLLRNLYMFRWRQKKKGIEGPPIEFTPSEED